MRGRGVKKSSILICCAALHVLVGVGKQFMGLDGAALNNATGVLLVGMGFICMEIEEAGRKND